MQTSNGELSRFEALTSASVRSGRPPNGPDALWQAAGDLRAAVEQHRQARKPARASASGPRAPRSLADAPKRRSSRLDGKPALNYNENALDLADRPQRIARSALPASHGEAWIKCANISVSNSGQYLFLFECPTE